MTDPSRISAARHELALPRLVLIEDDDNVRRSMTMVLRARGFPIDAYRSGTEFLLMRGQHGGDCLLIDYKMPRLDGLEVMKRARADQDFTPGIMITGYYTDWLLNRAISAGFSDVLEKPATPNSLIEKITAALN